MIDRSGDSASWQGRQSLLQGFVGPTGSAFGFDDDTDAAGQDTMRRRPGFFARALLAAAVGVPVGGCTPLDRGNELGSGLIIFDVKDDSDDDVGVSGAVARADGTIAMATADAGGRVRLRRLVPGDVVVRVDVRDADGLLVAGAVVDDAGVAIAPIARNAFASPQAGLTSQELDDVVVAPVATLAGTVDADACAPGTCRVVVARRVELGTSFKREVLGAVEAAAAVADDGSWSVAGLVPGNLVVALLHAARATSPGPVAAAVVASRPDAFAVGDAALAVGVDRLDVALPALQPLPDTTTVELELVGNVGDAGRVAGFVTFLAPSTTADTGVDLVELADLVDATPLVAPLATPTGLFDLSVQLNDGFTGLLRGALLLPGVPPPAPVVVGGLDFCDLTDVGHDCDGDDREDDEDDDGNGILDKDEPRPCNPADPDRDCDGDGTVASADPDDDGDGQPDVTETVPCRGPGRGTDLDGDCLCEPFDPLPGCASNDPADCAVAAPVVCPD
jgi:hypothetical protein